MKLNELIFSNSVIFLLELRAVILFSATPWQQKPQPTKKPKPNTNNYRV